MIRNTADNNNNNNNNNNNTVVIIMIKTKVLSVVLTVSFMISVARISFDILETHKNVIKFHCSLD